MKKITLLLCTLSYVLMGTLLTTAQWQRTELSSGYFGCFAVSGTNIFAVDTGVVWLSNNSGTTWTTADNGLEPNGIWSLATSGTNIFAGTESGGIFLSTDTGRNWSAVNNGLTDSIGVTALAVSGTNIFAGMYYGGGVFLSTDTGRSWSAVNNGLTNDSILSLAVSGTNIFAGTKGGVFLSTDTGMSWKPVNNGLTDSSFVYSFAISGTNIFAGSFGSDIFLSSNNGESWTRVYSDVQVIISSLAVSGTNIFAGTEYGGVFLSTDTGRSWTAVNDGLTNDTVQSLAVSGTDIFAGTYGGGVFKRSLSDILGVENINAFNNDITIYPNPATNQLTIQTTSFQNEAVMVWVMDVLGREASPPTPLQRRGENAAIDVSGLATGIYFVEMSGEKERWVGKFVKE